jgi:hypothetical protein
MTETAPLPTGFPAPVDADTLPSAQRPPAPGRHGTRNSDGQRPSTFRQGRQNRLGASRTVSGRGHGFHMDAAFVLP